MKILVLNSGSSSLKFQLFEMPEEIVICSGMVENIGGIEGKLHWSFSNEKHTSVGEFPDHASALRAVSEQLLNEDFGVIRNADEIKAVGHRVVHGGEDFKEPIRITEEVKIKIKSLFSLAPLHNPPNYEGILVAEEVFPEAAQVAIFDTAFFGNIPAHAYRMAIPNELYKKYGIRNYGFHGTSHQYVSKKAIEMTGLRNSQIITIHLGNGCSMAAVKNGIAIDTSMGLGPLSGLIMGTRSGDIDPSVIFFLEENGFSVDKIKNILNKESGMKGLTGSNDLREVHSDAEQGNTMAQLALKMYAYRIKKYIGMYMAALGGVDVIVFTAGVGENDTLMREWALDNLEDFGIVVDKELNNMTTRGLRAINKGKVSILVIPTNEELEIAEQTYKLLVS